MATISGYDSSSIGILFSGLNSTSNKISFGTSDLLGINYSDYATIKNGSYSKLMKAYYAKDTSKETSSLAISSTSISRDSSALLGRIESASDDLTKTVSKLMKDGSDSLFAKTQTTGSDGKTAGGYDTDKIYKAVKEFTDHYNGLLVQGGDSETNSISRATKSLVNLTKANSKLLGTVGITIGTDNKLTLDEKTFKKADMNTVKSLFHSTGGYGYQTSVQAGMIESYAKNEAQKSNTYSQSGMYTYNYTTGEIYNTTI